MQVRILSGVPIPTRLDYDTLSSFTLEKLLQLTLSVLDNESFHEIKPPDPSCLGKSPDCG